MKRDEKQGWWVGKRNRLDGQIRPAGKLRRKQTTHKGHICLHLIHVHSAVGHDGLGILANLNLGNVAPNSRQSQVPLCARLHTTNHHMAIDHFCPLLERFDQHNN